MDLAGKNVVVTGGGRGIGGAIARRFHAAGANVVLADLAGADQAAADLGVRAVGVAADIATEAGNVQLIDAAVDAFGPIDLFFANAGVATGTDPIETDEATWEQAFAINLHAHRWAAKHLLPAWLERGDGYFCSTASAAGLLAQIGSAPYTLTKRAAVAFAEWLAITYGDRGIKVSCLCPQGVNTAMINQDEGSALGADTVRAAGDILEPEQVADIVHDSVVDERFLILPHPEVHRYMQHKAGDVERWLAGMRRLQRTVAGT